MRPSLIADLNERIGHADPASLLARLALMQANSSTFSEALLWRGLHAIKHQQPQAAFLYLANALQHLGHDANVLKLLAQIARDQQEPELARQWEARAAPTTLTAAEIEALALDTDHTPKCCDDDKAPDALRAVGVAPDPALTPPVDVIIPVYRGYEATCDCLHSVIAARAHNRTAHELVVMDDASPEPALVAELLDWARAGAITLIRQPHNLGFIRSMNRAMMRHPERDLVWLNADTRVHGDWLDRLRAHATREPRIASVTPLSNNGELTSVPEPSHCFAYPAPEQSAHLDQLARTHNAALSVPLELGCGFCFYVRRAALADIGLLDERTLSGGYGEDTDWCARAKARGWQHRAAADVFVAHRGSVSFGHRKAQLAARNNAILYRRYPQLQRDFNAYRRRDPLAPARQRLQHARLDELIAWMHAAPASIPPLGGDALHPRQLHLLAPPGLQHPLLPFLRPQPGSAWQPRDYPPQLLWLTWARTPSGLTLTLGAATPGLPMVLDYAADAFAALLADLRQLPLVGLVYHAVRTCPAWLTDLPQPLGLPFVLRPLDGSLPPATAQPAWLAGADGTAPSAKAPPHGDAPPSAPVWTPEALAQQPVIIADALDARLGARWLTLARQRARADRYAPLIVVQPGPWLAPLRATAQVVALPVLAGLTPAATARLAGLAVVVSLDDCPGAAWRAPLVAQQLQLPLLAPPSALARHCGAQPLPSAWWPGDSTPTPIRSRIESPMPLPASPPQPVERTFLHIGCGTAPPERLPELFRGPGWRELRLDIDPSVRPHLVGSSADLAALRDGCVEAIWSSHNLEHLDTHQVAAALRAMHRVLTTDGFALITLPDIAAIAALITAGRLTDTAYESPIGPITALDMLYGHSASLAAGRQAMAHRTAFDAQRLGQALLAAGFQEVRIRSGKCYDLWAYAMKQPRAATGLLCSVKK